ncbi:S9 family peptidase [Cesiribacter andamanensis]|uniref:Prolyl tripeptidyl peptidase n=1 Tax=Cesiribacter andamanensis AMV16 TaxID=1279009 RepID=M7NYE7_9BACT|nr:S9 family peptidase [Cesiribacter andamanensis]EMR03409.1 Prolyl tripeptidyl peptidase precursor [Cesiribacter andamanensis AMV16]
MIVRPTNGLSVLLALLLLALLPAQAQQRKSPSLEEIFQQNLFGQQSVSGINWMNDGRYYSSLRRATGSSPAQLIKYDITTGEPVATLVDGSKLTAPGQSQPLSFSGYSLSADESKVLLASEVESIYRRSSKAYYYIYDLKSGALTPLAEGDKQLYATFSPDGSKVAYVRNNNLYYKDLASMQEVAVTTDGRFNEIIYGSADWVYEEEFSFAKGFFWSPDSRKIAFYRFDERQVPEFNMQLWTDVRKGQLYPEDYKFKYPKAGEKNSVVNILVHHLAEGKNVQIDTGQETDIYLPRIYWTKNPDVLSYIRMNRLQNQLELLHANAATGVSTPIITEKAASYVDLDYNDQLIYLEDGKSFVRTSEQDGYKHIYHHSLNGDLIRQITSGPWEVTELVGVDEKRGLVYYISAEDSPLERQFYSISLKAKKPKKTRLSKEPGVVSINMSDDFSFYIQNHSSATEPLTVSLHRAPTGEEVKVLEDNQRLKQRLETHRLNTKEFFDFSTADGTRLHGYMIRPANFDATRQYPVLMYVYGGPGSQTVLNNFSTQREVYHSYLADQGYLVVSVDNRGTGARGRDFKHITYGQMGKWEVQDQIEAARYLGSMPYVDKDRIGIWGWSYGGYMSSLALFVGNEVFKTAIAVAPVTNWRFYDTIYTERYLKTPQENAEGYDAWSPLSHVDKLKGNYFLIHGTGDDNVHFQNAVALQDALISAGKQFQSFYYPNRNHGIRGGNTSLHLFQMMTDYLKANL